MARLPVPAWSVAAGDRGDAHRAAMEALAERLSADGEIPDVVHAHVGFPAGWAASALAEALGRPLVVTEHASFIGRLLADPVIRDRYLAMLGRAAAVVAVSRVLARELAEAAPAVERRLNVIPNVVATDAFTATSPAGRSSEELLFVGRRRASKGIADLLHAFRLVIDRRPTATLRLVGGDASDDDAPAWARQLDELGIAHAVTLEPAADRAGVVAAMGRAAVFVHPSPRETFGVVAAEAMAAGLPVVAIASGGVEEVLEGLGPPAATIVPAGDAAALATAILGVLDRRAEVDERRLRETARARYSGPVVARDLLDLYGTVIANRPRSGPAARSAGRVDPLPAIVALDRARLAEHLPALRTPSPPDLVALTAIGAEPVGAGRVIGVDGAGALVARVRVAGRRSPSAGPQMLRRLADPRGTIARRRLVTTVERTIRERIDPAIEAALGGVGAGGDGLDPPSVVCLDGLDHLAVEPLVRTGRVRPVAGGIDHLGDRMASLADPNGGT